MFEVWWVIQSSFYYTLLLSFTVKQFLKSMNLWQVTGKKVGCFTHSVCLGNVLLKDEELTIDCMHDMKKLLLTVVMLVSPLISL